MPSISAAPNPAAIHGNGTLAPIQDSRDGPRRILVADDDVCIVLLYRRVLIRAGYQVDAVADGEAAWKVLSAENLAQDHYQLLITDNLMPKLSGVQLVKKLRYAQMALPIILASADPPSNTDELQLAALLVKPFSPLVLLQAVEEVMHAPIPTGATLRLRKCARQLLAFEAASAPTTSVSSAHSAAFRVCERLRGPISELAGIGAYHSLLSRSLTLAGAEIPWLDALRIQPDASFGGWDRIKGTLTSRGIADAEVAIVSRLLGLLLALIGPALTLSLLNKIWPAMDDPKL